MTLDKRLVQTAVTGAADSQSPVNLPMEAIELEQFLRIHADETYWCGTWLGGCGHRLRPRKYTDRVCHFAHHATADDDTSPCARKSRGVASADHLYIQRDLLAWMTAQHQPATADLPRDADGSVGGQVLFDTSSGERLHVQLSATLDPAGLPADAARLLLGPQVPRDLKALTRQGYLHRIECVPDGSSRRPRIGTEHYEGTEWFELDECQLTPWGLSTPAVERIRRLRTSSTPIDALPRKKPPSAPVSAPTDRLPTVEASADDRRAAVIAALRDAVENDSSVSQLRHCRDQAEYVTQGRATADEVALMTQAYTALLRLERGVGAPTPPAGASAPRARRASWVARTLTPRLTAPAAPRPIAPAPVPGSGATSQPNGSSEKLETAAAAVRGALRKAAREQTTLSWAQLRQKLGSALPRLHAGDLADLLRLVDRTTPADQPMLSTLLAAADPGVIDAFRCAAADVGLDLPDHPDALRDVLDADTQRLHDLWRHR